MDLKELPALLAKFKEVLDKRTGMPKDYRIVIHPEYTSYNLFFRLAFVDKNDGCTVSFRSFSTLEELVEAMKEEIKSIWDCIPDSTPGGKS